MYKIYFSELLRKSPGNLLRNFLRHVLEMKSGEELQQQKGRRVEISNLLRNFLRHVLDMKSEDEAQIKINSRLLLDCITASGVPLNNIKEIQARLMMIIEKYWEAFHIQTLTGTVLQVQVGGWPGACYSPRIYEMLQSSRLTKFR